VNDKKDRVITVQVLNAALMSFQTSQMSEYRLIEDSYSKTELYTKSELYTKDEVDELLARQKEENNTCVQRGIGNPTVINVLDQEQFNSIVRNPNEIYCVKP
jgi:hypothetical protein